MLFILKNKLLYINQIKNIFNKKNYKYLTKILKIKKKKK